MASLLNTPPFSPAVGLSQLIFTELHPSAISSLILGTSAGASKPINRLAEAVCPSPESLLAYTIYLYSLSSGNPVSCHVIFCPTPTPVSFATSLSSLIIVTVFIAESFSPPKVLSGFVQLTTAIFCPLSSALIDKFLGAFGAASPPNANGIYIACTEARLPITPISSKILLPCFPAFLTSTLIRCASLALSIEEVAAAQYSIPSVWSNSIVWL